MEENAVPILLDLFLSFAKIGLFTFGGGYAMISLIDDLCVERKRWITHEDMMNVTVIAESTPGPVAINCSTFVGYKQKGMLGAVVATLGMILPSFSIIFLISRFLDRFLEIVWIANAFRGIKLAVAVLILDAGIRLLRKMRKKPLSNAIALLSFVLMLFINLLSLRLSTIFLMLTAGFISLSFFVFAGPPEKEDRGK